MDKVLRERLTRTFDGAEKVLFVSKQNHQCAQQHLAREILNFDIIQNPVNLVDISLVPYPQTNPILFASVARLVTGIKGQDILFQTLSQPQWRDRNWQLNLYGHGTRSRILRIAS